MANASVPDVGSVFGVVLRRFRLAAGVSQEELADRADVDRTFISRLERGVRQPTITTLIGLSEAMGVSAADLVRETETELSRLAGRKPRKKTS